MSGWVTAAQEGSNLLGTAANIWATSRQNKKQREWNVAQTNTQYMRDQSSQAYANWYNSPKNQMARFEEAGLNPHLIYGKGTPGQQQNVPKASKAEGSFKLPQMENPQILDSMLKYQGLKKLNAETDLVSATVNSQNMRNKITEGTLSAQIAQEILHYQKLAQQTKNEVSKGLILEQIRQLKIEQIKIEKAKSEMWENDINPNDPAWMRQLGGKAEGFWEYVKEYLKPEYEFKSDFRIPNRKK